MSKKPFHICIVVFRECDPSIAYGVFDTLWAAGRDLANITGSDALFEPRIVAAEAGPMQLITGVSIIPQDTIADIGSCDAVFVPNVIVTSAEGLRALDRNVLAWIARMHSQGAQIFAACGGSMVLAEAGLLDGQEATTHWAYAPLFRQEFPTVKLHAERLLVQTGRGHSVACSGGASSWQDLVLLMVARYAGSEEAIRMSKLFLYQWHRDGQLPYASMVKNIKHGDAVIDRAQQWIADNYSRSDIVADVVRRSGLPKRTFNRRFNAATGYAPLAYIQAMRIEEAKQALETGDATVEEIGRQVGYEDTGSFRRMFKRLAGMGPADYRRKLQPPAIIRAIEPRTDSRQLKAQS